MGINLKELVTRKEVEITDLKGKRLAIDAFNILYQFLSTIRQRDGTLLTDSKGQVTSHLTGLFSRTTRLMEKGIKLVFVFDGVAPKLKTEERARRAALKAEAAEKFEKAKSKEDIEGMKKYAQRTSKLTKDMIEEAKKLVTALGLPIVQAPSEGEAQAAYMASKGDIFATVSQDYDALLFKTPKLIQNLTISQRRRLPGRVSSGPIPPMMITLEDIHTQLGINQDQLIALGMLIGTDFNPGGVKGLGPKKALQLVKKHPNDLNALFKEADWDNHANHPWKEVHEVFTKIPVKEDYDLEWSSPDATAIIDLMVRQHDFSAERIQSGIDMISKASAQKGLGDFF